MRKQWLALTICSGFLVACGGGGGSDVCDATHECTICAPVGSSIAGACITIPKGALDAKTNITLAPVGDIITNPSLALGDAVQVNPTDTVLKKSAALTIPYEADNVGSVFELSDSVVFKKHEDDLTFIANGDAVVDTGSEKMTFSTKQLGKFQAGFKVESHMAKGDFTEIPMGASAGTLALDAKAGEEYHLLVTSVPQTVFTDPDAAQITSSFTITAGNASGGLTKLAALKADDSQHVPPSTPTARELFEQTMRAREIALIRNGQQRYWQNSQQNSVTPPFTPSFKTADGIDHSGGATAGWDLNEIVSVRMLDVSDSDNDFSTSDTVVFNAEVRKITANGFVIVVDSSSVVSGGFLDSVETALLNNIQPRHAKFFGPYSAITDDDKLVVVVTSKIADNILGFFDAENDFERIPNGDTDASNEEDIVFVTVTADVDLLESTICHELQHAINFSEKTLNRLVSGPGMVADPNAIPISTPFEEPFLNEGMSYTAEMLCGYGDLAAGPVELLKSYLTPSGSYEGQGKSSLSNSAGSVSLKVRGANFLYIRYLFEQAGGATQGVGTAYSDNGGAAFLKKMLSTSRVGVASYNTTFAEFDPHGRDFVTTFKDYMLTLYNESLTTPLISAAADSRFSFDAQYNDNFTGTPVGVDLPVDAPNGPAIDDFDNGSNSFTADVVTNGARIVRYGSAQTGQVIIRVSGNASGNLQARVVRSD